jgi:hypothetical protein
MPPCNEVDRGCVDGQDHSARKRANFHQVSRHEKVCETDLGSKAADGRGNTSWCSFPLTANRQHRSMVKVMHQRYRVLQRAL